MRLQTKFKPGVDGLRRAPTQRDYERMVREIRAGVVQWTEELAAGTIDAEEFVRRFDLGLLDGHTRAWVLGRQLGGDLARAGDLDLLMGRGARDLQSEYLVRFLGDLAGGRYRDAAGKLSAAAVRARADLYFGAMRSTSYDALVETADEDDEWDWVLGLAEHCDDCVQLAALSPYTRHTLFTKPGAGDTACLGNCHCTLKRRRGGLSGFSRVDF